MQSLTNWANAAVVPLLTLKRLRFSLTEEIWKIGFGFALDFLDSHACYLKIS